MWAHFCTLSELIQVSTEIHAGLSYTITIPSTGHDLGDREETGEDKKQMEQHAKFSFCRSFDGPRGLREGREGVPAIIISPALPVIVIVLTNAQIAFQIAPLPPSLRKQDPVPAMPSF